MEVLTRGSFQLLVSVRPCWKLRTRAVVVERYTNTARFNKKTATDAVKTPRKSSREKKSASKLLIHEFREKGKKKARYWWSFGRTSAFKLSPALHDNNIMRDISQSDHNILHCFWFPGNLIFIFPASSHFRLASRSNSVLKPQNSQEKKVFTGIKY